MLNYNNEDTYALTPTEKGMVDRGICPKPCKASHFGRPTWMSCPSSCPYFSENIAREKVKEYNKILGIE